MPPGGAAETAGGIHSLLKRALEATGQTAGRPRRGPALPFAGGRATAPAVRPREAGWAPRSGSALAVVAAGVRVDATRARGVPDRLSERTSAAERKAEAQLRWRRRERHPCSHTAPQFFESEASASVRLTLRGAATHCNQDERRHRAASNPNEHAGAIPISAIGGPRSDFGGRGSTSTEGSAVGSRTACCSQARRARARRCSPGRLRVRRTPHSSRWRPRSSSSRSSVWAHHGCAISSSRRRTPPRRSCSSTSSTRSAGHVRPVSPASAAATTSASRR